MRKRILNLMICTVLIISCAIPATLATEVPTEQELAAASLQAQGLLAGDENGDLRLEAPFVTWSKADIVAEGLTLGVPYELTWSCYEGGAAPCGACATCIDRAAAFAANHVEDPALKG